MPVYKVGYFVGSLSSTSINRVLSRALIRLAPENLEFTEIGIGDLPLYSPDYDNSYPPEAIALKEAIGAADAVLFVSPEYNRSIPGALKNAIDWASRPWGQNSFDQIPAAVIGASIGQIGTAMAQQSLRGVLSFCNARQLTAPEAYIRYTPEIFPGDGEVADEPPGSDRGRRVGSDAGAPSRLSADGAADEQTDEIGGEHGGHADRDVADDRGPTWRATQGCADPSRQEQADHDGERGNPDATVADRQEDHDEGQQRADRERQERGEGCDPGARQGARVDPQLHLGVGRECVMLGQFGGDAVREVG